MADPTPKLYEGMFLMSQSSVSAGLGNAIDLVKGMLDRAEAEVITLAKWEERKLAYPIDGHKRGTFLLSLFKVTPTQIANIERDCNLSEDVVRVMMTKADHMGETEIAEAIKEAQVSGDRASMEDEPETENEAETEDADLETSDA